MKIKIKYFIINNFVVWGGFSVNNATLNRFFSLHFLLPFLLAGLVIAHLIALHVNGSNNPNGISNNSDRLPFHPYFVFKDLVTVFAFLLVLSIIVFYYPNVLGLMWPNIMYLIVYIIYVCAISWKYTLNKYLVKIYNKTILVSDLLFKSFLTKNIGSVTTEKILNKKINPNIVRYYYKVYNQQITKVINLCFSFCAYKDLKVYLILSYNRVLSLLEIIGERVFNVKLNLLRVGISETISTHKKRIKIKLAYGYGNLSFIKIGQSKRGLFTLSKNLKTTKIIKDEILKDNHNNIISLNFKQWFAGITDGDGYIYVRKEGYVGFELTLPACDEKVLRVIQNKFGGNIKARSGVKAVRYRSQNKDTVTKIIKCLNGLILNNIRLAQLHKACLALNIPIKDPVVPTLNSAYFSGLLDSDGSINFYKHNYNETFRYQLTISISNKSRCNIEFLLSIIGGQIYFDKSNNGLYIWKANSKLLHLILYDYFLKFPPKTIKAHRTYLIKEFHELNELKVYRDSDKLSMNYKKWKRFLTKWDNKN